jgi:hypothetical protein
MKGGTVMKGTDAGQQHGSQVGIADSVREKEGTGGAHTPETWSVGCVAFTVGRCGFESTVLSALATDTAPTQYAATAYGDTAKESARRARLIAAAPDLLARLKVMLVEHHGNVCGCRYCLADLALIAKAEGR